MQTDSQRGGKAHAGLEFLVPQGSTKNISPRQVGKTIAHILQKLDPLL